MVDEKQKLMNTPQPRVVGGIFKRTAIRLMKVVGIVAVWLLIFGIILWNWPTGFYTLATAVARATSGLHLKYVQVRGIPTPVLEGGENADDSTDSAQIQRTTILFVHGWGTSKEAMMGEMGWFNSTRRVIAPDLPGFGDNPLQDGQPALDGAGYVKWLEDFRVAAKLGRVDVVGESMGAALAAAYAAAYPDSVRRIVLQSAAGLVAPHSNTFMSKISAGENPLLIENGDDFDRVIGLCFAKPPPIPKPYKAFLVARALSMQNRQLEMITAMRDFLLRGNTDILGLIRAPTLIIYGSADQITDASLMDVYRAGIAHSTGLIIPGAGHVVFYDAPQQTYRAIKDFLDF